MLPDDYVCYCYRVSLRKLVNYARRERPKLASLMHLCLDAGTGCGWCIPYLERIAKNPDGEFTESPEEYAAARKAYLDRTGRKPPPQA